ncbi:DNA dC-_dU-editing enzyme APOBEC-3C isoform X3 [Equus asinus]
MEKLHRKTFSFHFRNLEFAYGRNCSYLCYQVEGRLSGSPGLSEQGVFVNEVCGKTRRHAELCFLDWFHDRLSPDEYYRVTWFISWSPCSYCAREVADFLKQHRNVKLSIFAARLYYYRDHVQGLRSLCSSGAQLAIMFFWAVFTASSPGVHSTSQNCFPCSSVSSNSSAVRVYHGMAAIQSRLQAPLLILVLLLFPLHLHLLPPLESRNPQSHPRGLESSSSEGHRLWIPTHSSRLAENRRCSFL